MLAPGCEFSECIERVVEVSSEEDLGPYHWVQHHGPAEPGEIA